MELQLIAQFSNLVKLQVQVKTWITSDSHIIATRYIIPYVLLGKGLGENSSVWHREKNSFGRIMVHCTASLMNTIFRKQIFQITEIYSFTVPKHFILKNYILINVSKLYCMLSYLY